MQLNSNDVLSEYCQYAKHIAVKRLDKYDSKTGQWLETIIEDPHAGPAETTDARIDFDDWFNRLHTRDQEIVMSLATGYTTGEVAKRFGLSPGRISQKRREYLDSWRLFQDEEPASNHDLDAVVSSGAASRGDLPTGVH